MATGITGMPAQLREWEREIDAAVDAAVEEYSELVAEEARANHPYTDRTRELTESIEALPAHGSALAGTLRGAVVAGADHAEYLEARPEFAFLEPAARRVERELARLAETAIERRTR